MATWEVDPNVAVERARTGKIVDHEDVGQLDACSGKLRHGSLSPSSSAPFAVKLSDRPTMR